MLFDRILDRRILCFDTETTGPNPAEDAVVELGAVVLERGQVTTRLRLRLNPGWPIPAEASAVHGIYDEHVAREPLFADVAERVASRFSEFDVFCGYNALRFDVPILNAELERAGHAYRIPAGQVLDPMVWYKRRHPDRSAKLGDVCQDLMVRLDNAHAALADAEAVALVLKACIGQGVMPVEAPFALEAQPREAAKLEAERAEFGGWWYRDRASPAILRLGRGKHRGLTLAEAPASYVQWALGLEDLPPAARAVFEGQERG